MADEEISIFISYAHEDVAIAPGIQGRLDADFSAWAYHAATFPIVDTAPRPIPARHRLPALRVK